MSLLRRRMLLASSNKGNPFKKTPQIIDLSGLSVKLVNTPVWTGFNYLALGTDKYFYTSTNLTTWTKTSAVMNATYFPTAAPERINIGYMDGYILSQPVTIYGVGYQSYNSVGTFGSYTLVKQSNTTNTNFYSVGQPPIIKGPDGSYYFQKLLTGSNSYGPTYTRYIYKLNSARTTATASVTNTANAARNYSSVMIYPANGIAVGSDRLVIIRGYYRTDWGTAQPLANQNYLYLSTIDSSGNATNTTYTRTDIPFFSAEFNFYYDGLLYVMGPERNTSTGVPSGNYKVYTSSNNGSTFSTLTSYTRPSATGDVVTGNKMGIYPCLFIDDILVWIGASITGTSSSNYRYHNNIVSTNDFSNFTFSSVSLVSNATSQHKITAIEKDATSYLCYDATSYYLYRWNM